ncbi:MAG: methylated-DNA--[protein]-cysteine S-methyltransferase [Alphaproteobacteria bacterium]|nr:methylated-DNA--[protein]-cysteine S-methyltransferase [Alphaproteobacteria bacterium]
MTTRRTVASPLGPLQLTARDGALVGLRFGPDGPDAGADDPVLLDVERQLGEYFAGRRRDFDLSLSLAGGNFELAVWEVMRRIPFGRTRTYGELADEIGGIARAVGIACGANPIAIIVPCHRVVGADGRLTGYSGGLGVETKAWLLRHELAVPLGDQLSLFAPPAP